MMTCQVRNNVSKLYINAGHFKSLLIPANMRKKKTILTIDKIV